MQAPQCARCRHRHLSGLPCWSGRYVTRLRAAVLAEYGDTCCHCGEYGARSVEHVQPRSEGGTDAIANLRPAHLACNISRGVAPMLGWGRETVETYTSPRW